MVRWTHFDASWRMTMRKDIIPFDWCVTTHGDVGQAFRIFTSNVPVVHNTFDMEVKEDGWNIPSDCDRWIMQQER